VSFNETNVFNGQCMVYSGIRVVNYPPTRLPYNAVYVICRCFR